MMWRKPEAEILPALEELGVGFVPYSPLANGFLSGKYDKHSTFAPSDFRNFHPRWKPEAIDANQVLLDLIKELAARKKATPAQISLAWTLAQKPWIVPIPGTTKSERLEENLGAADVEMTSEELSGLNNALSKIEIL
jgi:aryl-alcohol dehydrogenase-like predicted oxidoreductase